MKNGQRSYSSPHADVLVPPSKRLASVGILDLSSICTLASGSLARALVHDQTHLRCHTQPEASQLLRERKVCRTSPAMSTTVLNFVIAGHEDHPIYEADLSVKDSAGREERAQYLHQVASFPYLLNQGLINREKCSLEGSLHQISCNESETKVVRSLFCMRRLMLWMSSNGPPQICT